MSRLDELIQEYCPNGVEYKALKEVCRLVTGATPSKTKSEYWDNGTIPWMSSGEVNLKRVYKTESKITQLGYDKTSTTMVPVHSVVIALAGQGKTRGKVAITEIELCTNQSLCSIICSDKILYKFLYYYLDGKYEELRTISNGDGTRGGLSLRLLNPYLVPVPPLPVQEEIVRILDTFTELTAELQNTLQAELQARKRQYGYYKDRLLACAGNVPMVALGDLCLIKGRIGFRGYTQKDIVEKGNGAISLSPGNIVFNHLNLDECKYISWEKYYESPEIMIEEHDVILCKTGSTVGKVTVVEDLPEKATLNPQLVVLKDLKCNCRYLFYQLSGSIIQQQIRSSAGVGSVPSISQKALSKILIPLPSIEQQEKLVDILDGFDTLCNDLTSSLPAEIEARQKQYEYYRDKLLTFKPLP